MNEIRDIREALQSLELSPARRQQIQMAARQQPIRTADRRNMFRDVPLLTPQAPKARYHLPAIAALLLFIAGALYLLVRPGHELPATTNPSSRSPLTAPANSSTAAPAADLPWELTADAVRERLVTAGLLEADEARAMDFRLDSPLGTAEWDSERYWNNCLEDYRLAIWQGLKPDEDTAQHFLLGSGETALALHGEPRHVIATDLDADGQDELLLAIEGETSLFLALDREAGEERFYSCGYDHAWLQNPIFADTASEEQLAAIRDPDRLAHPADEDEDLGKASFEPRPTAARPEPPLATGFLRLARVGTHRELRLIPADPTAEPKPGLAPQAGMPATWPPEAAVTPTPSPVTETEAVPEPEVTVTPTPGPDSGGAEPWLLDSSEVIERLTAAGLLDSDVSAGATVELVGDDIGATEAGLLRQHELAVWFIYTEDQPACYFLLGRPDESFPLWGHPQTVLETDLDQDGEPELLIHTNTGSGLSYDAFLVLDASLSADAENSDPERRRFYSVGYLSAWPRTASDTADPAAAQEDSALPGSVIFQPRQVTGEQQIYRADATLNLLQLGQSRELRLIPHDQGQLPQLWYPAQEGSPEEFVPLGDTMPWEPVEYLEP